jgi:hypothetical protein
MTVIQQRKLPVKRLFTGLAGSSLAVVDKSAGPLDDKAAKKAAKKAERKRKAALRAAEWREKNDSAEFRAEEAMKKREHRKEVKDEQERVEAIEDALKQNPTNALNGPFVMTDAKRGTGLLVTGGYGAAKVSGVQDARGLHANLEGEKVDEESHGRAGKPKGEGSKRHESKDATERDPQFDDQFVQRAFFRFKNDKDVRVLRQFVYQNTFTNKSKALACSICREEVSPKGNPAEEVERSFQHFGERHPEAVALLMGKVAGTECLEDHGGIVRRHGGSMPVKCGKCRKILWKPGEPLEVPVELPEAEPKVRTDGSEAQNEGSNLVVMDASKVLPVNDLEDVA